MPYQRLSYSEHGAGEMAQLLWTYDPLAKNTSLIPSTHIRQHTVTCNSASRAFFCLPQASALTCNILIHGCTHIPTIKNKIKNLKKISRSLFFLIILYVWLFCLHECLCTSACLYSQRPEQGIWFPGTGFTEVCELCRCWELSPGSLEEELMLLATEPSF